MGHTISHHTRHSQLVINGYMNLLHHQNEQSLTDVLKIHYDYLINF